MAPLDPRLDRTDPMNRSARRQPPPPNPTVHGGHPPLPSEDEAAVPPAGSNPGEPSSTPYQPSNPYAPSSEAPVTQQTAPTPGHGIPPDVLALHQRPAEPETGLPAKALIGAAIAASVGLWAWALLILWLDIEIGWLAWGIGAGVGFTFHQLGGRGLAGAGICAVLTILAMFGGKHLGASWLMDDFQDQFREVGEQAIGVLLTEDLYDEAMSNASDFATVATDYDMREYMVNHDMSMADNPLDVEDEELEMFKQFTAPGLKELHNEQPGYEEWREEAMSLVSNPLQMISTTDVVMDGLTGIDILFLVLGVFSAGALALGHYGQR